MLGIYRSKAPEGFSAYNVGLVSICFAEVRPTPENCDELIDFDCLGDDTICILWDKVCDSVSDCPGSEDETAHMCADVGKLCGDGV